MSLSISELIRHYIEEVGTILARLPVEELESVVKILQEARVNKRGVFIFGNGGSAATASHFVCDLNKGAITEGQLRFRAIALTDNLPLISAWANDTSYNDVFTQQLENYLEPGDVVIGISVSGNSMNVVNALEFAKLRGATTLVFTGFDGGKVKDIAHLCLAVPNNSMEQVEDIHLLLEHIITTCLRETGISGK